MKVADSFLSVLYEIDKSFSSASEINSKVFLLFLSFGKESSSIFLGIDAQTEGGKINYVVKARIDQDSCIKCGRCHIVCEDTSHQAITNIVDGKRHFEVIDEECVGCNLCVSVCPVQDCITMEHISSGVDPRTKEEIRKDYGNWTTHPNNPSKISDAAE